MITLQTLLKLPTTWCILACSAVIGSFLNVCIFRIPRKIFWHSQRSFCPHCQKTIPFYHNIPLLSFLFLLGKSRCCDQKISSRYPLVELLTIILIFFAYYRFPFLHQWGTNKDFEINQMIRFLHAAVFITIMIVCSFIDLELMIIPNVLSISMILLTPLIIWLHPELSWKSGIYGVVLGGSFIYAIAWIYFFIRRQEGIGMGDAKLLAGIGGWLGYQAVIPVLLYASVLGSVIGITTLVIKRSFTLKTEIPFGPFLALGALIHLLTSFQLFHFLAS